MITATGDIIETHRCLGCGRKITAVESIAAMRGKSCRAKIRKAARTADLSPWTAEQIEDAREALEDGAVVPTSRPDVFNVVSSDGTEVYLTHPDGCNCRNGLQTRPKRPCWHRCAVALVLATDETELDETPATDPYTLAA